MHQKKGIANFQYSEPEFLISFLDRHEDWAVIACLVGGGQKKLIWRSWYLNGFLAVKNNLKIGKTRIS